jgi:pimeloyl-ACP methyl ester carboxylesterase
VTRITSKWYPVDEQGERMSEVRHVSSAGVTIAVREHSPGGTERPTVVLVHGYPDRQDMWDPVVAALPLGELHVVTYDVRGAGASEAPAHRGDYRCERLVDDLVAVLDAVLPGGARAHLVGHDWGSVQLWDAVGAEPHDPRLRGRLASFTSISGPSLDHLAHLIRHPDGREEGLRRQRRKSWYVRAFHVPLLPDLLWRHAHPRIARAMARRERLDDGHWGGGLGRDAANGLNLYRANVLRRLRHPRPLRVRVPVLVVRPVHDHFLDEVTLEDLDRFCADVRVESVDAGHWVTRTHPDRVAALVLEQIRRSGLDR